MNKYIQKGLMAVAGITMLFGVAACHPDQDTQMTNTQAPKTQTSQQVDPADDSGVGLCVGVCVGPHINLNDGSFSVFSTGPGMTF
jgi:hypothetical protein